MNKLISFNEAIEITEGKDKVLLLGNGFSNKLFDYKSLLAAGREDSNDKIWQVFDELDTQDFEIVIRTLEDAAKIHDIYGDKDPATNLRKRAEEVRKDLVKTINKVHPKQQYEVSNYETATAFINQFNKIFTLNYDLLLYWTTFKSKKFRDGFGFGEESEIGTLLGPFKENADCQIFNLHGGLHLFKKKNREVHKARRPSEEDYIMKIIEQKIIEDKRLPLYVAEGTSAAKLDKIHSDVYLRHCYRALEGNKADVFTFGYSASENDEHISRAIFKSEAKHIYFGVYETSDETIVRLQAKLSKYQRENKCNEVSYTLFDAKTVKVWDD